jgi:hypothetical protein
MKALFALITLLFTIGLAFCIGIGAGYAAICGILNAFSSRREKMGATAQIATAPTVGD